MGSFNPAPPVFSMVTTTHSGFQTEKLAKNAGETQNFRTHPNSAPGQVDCTAQQGPLGLWRSSLARAALPSRPAVLAL